MDKIVVNMDTDQRECVACGFSEERPGQESPGQERPGQERPGQERPGQERPESQNSGFASPVTGGAAAGVADKAGELPTRVSRAAARRVETPAEVVTLIDPGKKAGRD